MEKKLNSFILSVFTILLLSFALLPLFLCLGKINESKKLQTETAMEPNIPAPAVVDFDYVECCLGETEDAGESYIKKIIFLGESTTYGLQRYGVLPGGRSTTQVWTGATCSDRIVRCSGTLSLSPAICQTRVYYPDDGTALTIFEAVQKKSPEYLIVTIGLNNGASYYSEDEFKQCYRGLLNSIASASSETTVILQSLFPVARSCRISAYTPERIRLCNLWIQDLAREYEIGYLDTASILSDADGYLCEEYDNGGDGIHLNELGLRAVLQYIRTHAHPRECVA